MQAGNTHCFGWFAVYNGGFVRECNTSPNMLGNRRAAARQQAAQVRRDVPDDLCQTISGQTHPAAFSTSVLQGWISKGAAGEKSGLNADVPLFNPPSQAILLSKKNTEEGG